MPSGEAAPAAAHRGSDGVDDHGVGHKGPILTPNQIRCQTIGRRRSGAEGRGAGPLGLRSTNIDGHAEGLGPARRASAPWPSWPARRASTAGAATAAGLVGRSGTAPAPDLGAGQPGHIRYCNNQKARITEPAILHGPAPAAVYVHGGSWVSGDYDTGGFIINRIGPALAARGFVVVSLNYRLGPHDHWPAQIVDVKCAIRYLRANARRFHIDPNAIGAWGQSAGGHLVALLGTAGPSAGWDVGAYRNESSGVQAVVDMAGPSDLLTMGDQGDAVLVAESFISLLGDVPNEQLGADLQEGQPDDLRAQGRPALPHPRLEQRRDRLPGAVAGAGLVPRRGRRAPPAGDRVRRRARVRHGGRGALRSRRSSQAVVDFFVRTLMEHKAPVPVG